MTGNFVVEISRHPDNTFTFILWGKVLKKKLKDYQMKCAITKEEILNRAIYTLSEKQQLAVKSCFDAAKIKSRRGMRYGRQWLYECILLRIKSAILVDEMKLSTSLTFNKMNLKFEGFTNLGDPSTKSLS
ncbi:uncharacterized protein LOC127287502 isoform X2 [Leptopilina boulardi]|uniref:uncharacterized protein LOC127287502 isoform X2 n=1 Tax=Leptopilina boulardi TaxID=63433 RepID=UPI0021F536C1|nr:uncharacterized protein LOC127287502 isoform X2 [Leptopilina boulardi]